MVHLWNYKLMAEVLRLGMLSKLAFFGHAILFTLLGAMIIFPPFIEAKNIAGDLSGTVGLLAPAFWFMAAYLTNRKGDGLHVISRYVCLFTPIIVRAFVFATVCALPVGLLFGYLQVSQAVMREGNFAATEWEAHKAISTAIITDVAIWFLFVYPMVAFIRGFRIAAGR